MKIHLLNSSSVEVGVSEECGHLYPVRFFFGDKIIEPMHVAPWQGENLNDSIPPMLKYLRGDFFCAPFGNSDLLADETRGHGSSANDKWNKTDNTQSSIKFKLSKKIMDAEIVKEISIQDDEQVVYQKHIFKGGNGKLPVGYHAMLKVNDVSYLSFSDFEFAGTPPQPVEMDPLLGRSVLKYPQRFSDLNSVLLNDRKIANISAYPFAKDHEDLFMIITKKDLSIGWSALSCPKEGWLWFSIKNTNVLPNTVIWLSNGGRYYPPFSSRHKNVIGIEETTSYFHLGHKASIEENFLNNEGYRTYIELNPCEEIEIPYLFGLVEIPEYFGKVISIVENQKGIEIKDNNNNAVKAKVNLNFLKDIK